MAAALQVANAFAVDFVERVAKPQSAFNDLYCRHATLTVNDFDLGVSEKTDGDVPPAVQQWAASLQGSHLRVDSVNAAPVYGGVNVFMTLTAVGELHQYFHVVTTLEAYADNYGVDCFYVRHQVIARVGAVKPEAPPAPEPEPTPAPEAAAPAKKTPTPEPQPEEKPQRTPTPEPQPEPTPKPEEAEPAAAAAAPAEPAQAEEKPAAAPAPSSAKPKSWASLVSSAPAKAAEHRPVRVVARDAPAEKKEAAAPKKEATAPKEAPAAKRPPPRERKAPEPVGDRLMFNINGAVTDDEIRAALGAMAPHLVSLRNNSAKGHVFMDFAENVAALDEINKAQPVIGAAKLKMSVFRQRARE